MGKIKILHIIKSLGRGGAEMLLPETLKVHDKDRFDFHYIYFLPWKDQMVEVIRESGGIVRCVEASDNIRLLFQYNEIVKYCKKNGIDLIHCHLPWAGFVGRLVHKITKTPVIYTEHNMQERYHPVTKIINRLTFNFQNLALGVSEDVTHSIEKNIQPNIPLRTLLNGVNTNSFRRVKNSEIRDEFGIPEDAIVIGNVAVFRFQKRLVEWLQLMKKINQKNSNVYGVIVGAGPLEQEIKAEWKRLGLEGVVFFPGLQTNVKPYFESMDIFMMTSSFEGLPIALLEAMSMECAIVSTNAGGIKEVIRDEKDGLIFPVDKWQNLENAVISLVDNSEKMSKFKEAARKRVIEEFSLEKMVNTLEKYYTEFSS